MTITQSATSVRADDDTSAAEARVTATGVSHRYGDTTVLHDLDLDVPGATIQGMVGPSGSGKTTTVRLLTGLLRPTSGTVRVFGRDPSQLGTSGRQRIGYMPQLGVLHPDLTVSDNLRYLASLFGVRRPRRRIAELLEELDLVGVDDKKLTQISGGMQRRVALIGALLHDPDLLFLDEPTTGLDPVLRNTVWTRLQEMRDRGVTVFVTTQIVSESTRCDRVALLVDGTIVAQDTPEGLRRQAAGGEVVVLRTQQDIPTQALAEIADVDGVAEVGRGTGARTVRVVLEVPEGDVTSIGDAVLPPAGAPAVASPSRIDAAIDAVTSAVARRLTDHDVEVQMAERETSDFEDVFVQLLEQQRGA